MKDDVRTSVCERARAWVSLSLDGELSELERRLLDVHVERCAPCAAFEAEVTALVGELRAASQEPLPVERRVVAWQRRPVAPVLRIASRAGAVAAAAAAAIAMFSLGAGSVGDVSPAAPAAPIILDATSLSSMDQELADLREAQRARLMSVIPDQSTAGKHSGPNPL